MATIEVEVLIGQSNQEGLGGDTADLPAALQGAQAGRDIWNHENSAIETLDATTAGVNLPNNTTAHTAPWFGPEMTLAQAVHAEKGAAHLFKYAISDTTLGPDAAGSTWSVQDNDLWANFKTRWAAYAAAVSGGGDTIGTIRVYWMQGESDAGEEGNDLAYYGLWLRFISEIRTYLAAYTSQTTPIMIVAGLPSTLVGTHSGLNNVRGALRVAGWKDPFYRIVDTAGYTTVDGVHFNSEYQQVLGNAFWAAANLTENNTMPLETYDLASMRTSLAGEFGLDTTIQAVKDQIDSRINKAYSFVMRKRPTLEEARKTEVIQVGETLATVTPTREDSLKIGLAQKTGTGGATAFLGSEVQLREFINYGDPKTNTGFMLTAKSAGALTFDKHYPGDANQALIAGGTVGNPTIIEVSSTTIQGGTTEIPTGVPTFEVTLISAGALPGPVSLDGTYRATRIDDTHFSIPVDTAALASIVATGFAWVAKRFSVSQGIFELPQDYRTMISVHPESGLNTEGFRRKSFTHFQRIVRDGNHSSLSRVYCVASDPLGLTDRKYLYVYPYYGEERESLHIQYYANPPKLVADGDTPILSLSDRLVLYDIAAWFVAQWQKDLEMTPFYRDSGLAGLEDVLDGNRLTSDLNDGGRLSSGLPDIPQAGSNYPKFTL